MHYIEFYVPYVFKIVIISNEMTSRELEDAAVVITRIANSTASKISEIIPKNNNLEEFKRYTFLNKNVKLLIFERNIKKEAYSCEGVLYDILKKIRGNTEKLGVKKQNKRKMWKWKF